MSNEKIIRQLLKNVYSEKYPNSFIRDEFTHDSLNTRNDLFLVDDSIIISFEIKSDRDVLKRLRAQVQEYRTYSSLVVIALDTKHMKKFQKDFKDLLYSNVTVLEYDGAFHIRHEGIADTFPNVAKFLWSEELYLMRPRLPRKKKDEKRNLIYKDKSAITSHRILKLIYDESILSQLAYSIFRKRLEIKTDYRQYKPQLTNNQCVTIEEHSQQYLNFLST